MLYTISSILQIVTLVLVAYSFRYWNTYSKLDRAGVILNAVLFLVYAPLSLVGQLLLMGCESFPKDASKTLGNIFMYMCMWYPTITYASVLLSAIFRKFRYSKVSFALQFLPLIVFGIMAVLLDVLLG